MKDGTQKNFSATETTVTGEISGLGANKLYSVIVVATKTNFPNFVSEVQKAVASSWIKGITDLNVESGDNDGEIKYSFSATEPTADSYTLYYVTGEKTIDLTRKGQSIGITSALTGKISGLIGETYSVAIVAVKAGLPDVDSGVKRAKTPVSLIPHKYPDLEIKRGGINPYGMHLGAIDHRALAYSFSEIGAVSYTMYFVEGANNNAKAIISTGTAIPVEPKAAGAPGYIGGVSSYDARLATDPKDGTVFVDYVSYTIAPGTPVFDIDKTYSAVVVAKKPGSDLVSDVVPIGLVPNNTLTIPDLPEVYSILPNAPAGRSIRVAVILSGSGLVGIGSAPGRRPKAIGYRQPGTNTFVFNELSPPLDGVYDPATPWTGTANNPIALSDTEKQPNSLMDSRGDGYLRYLPRNTNTNFNVNRFVRTMSQFYRP
jgi:hypothetical protein